MHLLVATSDPILLSYVSTLLDEAEIGYMIADAYVSAVEAGIGAFPRRLLVAAADKADAERVLRDAGLAHELYAP